MIKRKVILLKLINLINGYMRTPKIESLHRLIDWFNNENIKNKNYDYIKKFTLDKSSISDNSWLSGFIDADGNFYLNWKVSKKSKSIHLRPINIIYYLRLSQKQMYTRKVDPSISISYFDIMNIIAVYLKTSVLNIERKKTNYIEKGYLIKTDKIESKEQIFAYLNKYPLFGYKYFSQLNIEKIHNLIKESYHKTEEGKNKFIEYSDYKKYDSLSWNHLDNFYSI